MKQFILLLLFFAAKNITSQNGWATYSTNLPSGAYPNNESCIFVDNAGNKWIGFSSGVSSSAAAFARFNGTWTIWNKSNTPVLPSNSVKCFAQDNTGNIWVGSSGGLVKFDGSNFTVYTTVNGLPHNNIYCLEYVNNMLYIGTQNGLSRYDGVNFTNYTVANSLFPFSYINGIKAETPNKLWAVSGSSLVCFTVNSTFTSSSYTTSVITPSTSLFSIYIDGYNNKWLNSSNGLIKYDNVNFIPFNVMYPDYVGPQPNYSNLVKGPNNGILVVGSNNTGPYPMTALVEFLSSGNYSVYPTPQAIQLKPYTANDLSGKTYITGLVSSLSSSLTSSFYSFDYSNFSPVKAFGEGVGVTNKNFKYLDVNRVKAGIANRGDMWWGVGSNGNASYAVPNTNSPQTDPNAGFAASLWLGGLDASNQLHTSAQTYRQTGNDFWPGPLDTTNASIDTLTAYNYDKIWKIDYNDINTFITQFSLGNVPFTYTPTPDILTWPAKGTGNNSRNLAPFVDVNNNGIYDPMVGGDYPKIKGDQALYFIFNDNFAPHTETGGLPFGIEVHAMAYAYGCPKVLNGRNELAYTTFYDYKIYNRSANNYHDVYLGFWTDVDLGNYQDDYLGSSVQDNLGFCYNSDGNDNGTSGAPGYGLYPPAVGTTILKGPLADVLDGVDNDHDSIIDEAGEQCLLSVFDYYNNNIGSFPQPTTNPFTKYHYYNILEGNWRDSTILTCGGNGYGGTVQTKHVYPWSNYIGNPCGTWTEYTAGNLPGDRRYITSSGPFDFPANSSTEVEYAYVWSVDSTATSNINLASVNKLISDVQKIRAFYNTSPQNCLASVSIGIKEYEKDNLFSIYPNPANTTINIRSEVSLDKSQIKIMDVLGKTVLETKNTDLYQIPIDISALNSGIYFLNIKFDNDKTAVKKFVKQ